LKVLLTGASGFIGKNLMTHIRERPDIETITFLRGEDPQALLRKVESVDFIFHLAGVNRPKNEEEFVKVNSGLTQDLCDAVRLCGRNISILYASSSQVGLNNAYARSKSLAESSLLALSAATDVKSYIYRLPNVFGKWCRPNYNSVVATFCHNIAHDLPIQIDDPLVEINLAHVDDVVFDFLRVMDSHPECESYQEVQPTYRISIGNLAEQIYAFKSSRKSLVTDPVGKGLTRALYSTFITYFQPENFSYSVVKHEDDRGIFVEAIKTTDSGQFSYFTAYPGVTRGGHYHHAKTEKFLVIKGKARFCFRHIDTGETYEHYVESGLPEIVESIPGWSHNITNIGKDEMIVMLWANEIFDPEKPDTYPHEV
jgi:UDP-2-acetamido-2,6-beta-L-arabino-hexul-4-ose reductase